jgi:predicted acyl esterase
MATSGPPPPSPSFRSKLRVKELFPDAVIIKTTPAAETTSYNYQGFHPSTQTLRAGYVKDAGRRAFGVDTIFDRDVEIVVRDGARLFSDIFRPATSETEPVPALIPWSPYGKSGVGAQNYDVMAPFRVGIPHERTSGFEKFEAPDPAEWAERGYAVINIDARGAYNSDGVITYFGDQEAEDIYDVIEWLIKQKWCTGSVVMAGNSWLSLSQINFASRMKHPALKALAPWEGFNDFYRHAFSRGGRPHLRKFHAMISGGMAGPEGAEDVFAMTAKHPFYDDYWEEKRIAIENIDDIPLYVLASYSSMLHTYGSFAVFRDSKTKTKWLRVHPYQECKSLRIVAYHY